MSALGDIALAGRALRAFGWARALRPVAPAKAVRAVRAARELGPTPATIVAVGAATAADRVMLVDEAGPVTWGEHFARARGIAGGLTAEHGAGPHAAVAIMCRNHRGFVEGMTAAALAGADILLLNTDFPGPQLAQVLERQPIAAVVLDDEFDERFDIAGWDGGRVLTDAGLDALAGAAPPAGAPEHHSRVTMLTSGTTGVPKGAARGDLPLAAILGPVVTMLERVGLRHGEPIAVGPPLFHGFGLGFLSIGQAIGAPVLLQRRFAPAAMLATVAEHRAACFVGVPAMLQRILALDPSERSRHDTSSLRAVVAAGAPLPPNVSEEFMDAYGDIVYNGYGTTEGGFAALATPADLRAAPGTIGRPTVGVELAVLGADRAPVVPGETGHIFTGGDFIFEGYVGGGGKEVVGGLMNTGDLGHRDANGRVFVDGREDDMIVSGGENVFPREVEDTLAEHAGVADVAVVGVADEDFGQRLKAFVVAGDGPAPTAEELLAHVRSNLARYKIPREIVFLEEIPRNPTGKVLRRQLV